MSLYQYTPKGLYQTHTCGCIGPQNGEPLCPCQMRGVEVKDGRYVKTIDLGPVDKFREATPGLKQLLDGLRK